VEALVPAMDEFKPGLVLISAGFDSRVDDLLGRFTLSDKDFVDLTKALLKVADKYAKGRVVSMLEGGYNLSGLASAATAHAGALLSHTRA
jgi:acetoin utilization deacetylase AcuC-like enzyme